jgi:hypothetical protein
VLGRDDERDRPGRDEVAFAQSHAAVVVAARSAAESSNQTMAMPSQAGSRPRL